MLLCANSYTEASPLQFGKSASSDWRKLLNHVPWAPNHSGRGFEYCVAYAQTAIGTVARSGAKVASVLDMLSIWKGTQIKHLKILNFELILT